MGWEKTQRFTVSLRKKEFESYTFDVDNYLSTDTMESIRLPPPIVIAPIDDDGVPVGFPQQNASSCYSFPPGSMGHQNICNPAPDSFRNMRPSIPPYEKFRSDIGYSYQEHRFPGTSTCLQSQSAHFVPPPPHAIASSPTSLPPYGFSPEPNNNYNFQLAQSNLPSFPQYGPILPNNMTPFMLSHMDINKGSMDKGLPQQMPPGYNSSAVREKNPMKFGHINPYGNSILPGTGIPPKIFKQYNLNSDSGICERPMFPFLNTFPQVHENGEASDTQQTSNSNMDSGDTRNNTVPIFFHTVDGKRVPCLQRGSEIYTSVRSVEVKLLAKFPNAYPEEVKKRPPIKSTKMLQREANAFNQLNKENLFEYGIESFEQDLLVKLSDFEAFYGIIKKHFPKSPTPPHDRTSDNIADGSRAEFVGSSSKSGGWMQLNNTIVPYINRGGVKYLPICIVKYAAGLPLSDEPFNEFLKSDECKFLNEQCESAGLTFSFHTMTVIGSLENVLRHSSTRLVINELPMNNPFDTATYDPTLEPGYNPPRATTSQLQKKPQTVTKGERAHRPMPSLVKIGGSQSKAATKPVRQTSDIINELKQMTNHVEQAKGNHAADRNRVHTGENKKNDTINDLYYGHAGFTTPLDNYNNLTYLLNTDMHENSHKARHSGIYVPTKNESDPGNAFRNTTCNKNPMSDVQQKIGEKPTASVKKTMKASSKNREYAENNLPSYVFKVKAKTDHNSSTNQKKETHKRSNDFCSTSPSEPGIDTSSTAIKRARKEQRTKPVEDDVNQSTSNTVPQIVSEKLDGKSISCLKRPDGHIYALLEAVSRVYFFNSDISEVVNVIENVLGIETVQCTESEEKAFISFYGLPTSHLKVSSMLKVETFKQYLPILTYMFEKKSKDKSSHKPPKPKVEKLSPPKKLSEKSSPKMKDQKLKRKKSKKFFVEDKKTSVVVMQDFMKSSSLREKLCHLHQIKITI